MVRERSSSLWLLAASPSTWAVHFFASYITGAIWCGRMMPAGDHFFRVRASVAIFTIAALIIVGVIGRLGYRWHRAEGEPPPHDADTPEDRQRFLGFAIVLLSGLSAVAVIYTSLVVLFVSTCR